MSILDFDKNTARNTKTQNEGSTERAVAKLWMNIGYDRTLPNADGESEVKFVSLPVGIPLDTMQPLAIKGQSESYGQLRAAQNDLLKQLQAAGDALEPGEEKDVRLVIRIRKAADPMVIKSEDNPLAFDISSLIG